MMHETYQTALTGRFLIGTVVSCCLFAYAFGAIARLLLVEKALASISENTIEVARPFEGIFLPTPTVSDDKVVPPTIYTGMNFDTRSSVISSQWLKNSKKASQDEDEIMKPANAKLVPKQNDTDYTYAADDEEHLPAGQHLLIDIDKVDSSFLDSEKQLATAMLEMVDNSGLTLLSYHCHGLQPSGVTCVGVLLESHVSFHTWPAEGVITLDLFTCGSTSLLNHLQLIQNLFAVPSRGAIDVEIPQVLWAYKRRGFDEQSGKTGFRDTFAYPLGIHGIEMKNEVASVITEQGEKGWVYDVHRSTKGTQDADVSRLFYLDGVLKASSVAAPASFESFVHPSMLSHPDPKRVLVFGSTTAGTLKEVLKHKPVEDVAFAGFDNSLLGFTSENLRKWNDCSDNVRSVENCLDDKRVQVIYENPNVWLHTPPATTSAGAPDLYDVALVDLFDLDEEMADSILSGSFGFLFALRRLLQENGVLVLHVANSVRFVDSRPPFQSTSMNDPASRQEIISNLERLGFTVKLYAENQPGFPDAKNYLVAFLDDTTAMNWNRNEAQVNRLIRERFAETRSGKPPLEFFDGSTMTSYSKFEQKFEQCADHPNPSWCDIRRQVYDAKLNSNSGGLKIVGSQRSPNASKDTYLNTASHCNESQSTEKKTWADRIFEAKTFVSHDSS